MDRRPFIAANWKMYKTIGEAEAFIMDLLPRIKDVKDRDIMIAPPFTALQAVANAVKGIEQCFAAGQNMHFEQNGAFTGEISPVMLRDIGVDYVILGHSERRHIFGEDDAFINKKVLSALSHDLAPVLCVGERLEDREAGMTEEVLRQQLTKGLNGIAVEGNSDLIKKIIIAYEPVWAIGTGKTATPEMAEDAHSFIRKLIEEIFNSTIAENILILYGGSVKSSNITGLMKEEDIDGVLVGGASLDVEHFERIIKF